MNGSGKTTLAQRQLSATEYVIVLDTKHELKWTGYKITSDIDECFVIEKRHGGHTIFRPRTEIAPEQIDVIYKRAYDEWGWTVYCDEVYQIGRSAMGKQTAYPPNYIRCLTAGRSRGVTIWTGTQRPKYFPVFAVTEAVHIFAFKLGSEDDRKDLYRLLGLSAFSEARQANLSRQEHDFLYYSRVTDSAVRAKLHLRA